MVDSKQFNAILPDLIDEIIADGIITRKDSIVCCTNNHSEIASMLTAEGFNAKEIDAKSFKGDCTAFICFLNHVDTLAALDKVDSNVKVMSLYRPLLSTNDEKNGKVLNSFFVRAIGHTEIIDEINDETGKKTSTPFDNRVFLYQFGGTRS